MVYTHYVHVAIGIASIRSNSTCASLYMMLETAAAALDCLLLSLPSSLASSLSLARAFDGGRERRSSVHSFSLLELSDGVGERSGVTCDGTFPERC